MRELKLEEARLDRLDEVLSFVNGLLEEMDCPGRTRLQIDVAVEEAYVNIAHYAYAPGTGPVGIRVKAEPERVVAITFVDRGKPYDPLARPDPDITLPAQERPIGGLGVYMVKKSMAATEYRREEGRNILTFRKKV